LEQHKQRFVEECLRFLDQRQQPNMQWLHDPNQRNVDNLNYVRREAARPEKKEFLKDKIDELEPNSKIKNSRYLCVCSNEFKKGYPPINDTVKDKNCDLFTDYRSILASWRNHFSHLLIVHGFNDFRQTEIDTAEPRVPYSSVFEFEMTFEDLKRHKSPGVDQITAELIKPRGRTF